MTLFCFGTRPEWLKIKPVIDKLDKSQYKLLFTGQHTDLLKSIIVDYAIDMKPYNINRLDNVVANCMTGFPNDNFDGVLVQGDTASAFGCALAAFHRGIKIYYLEAGLRTGNLQHPYPEEAYRQMIARISDINFCPTELSKQNLINEGVSGVCYVTGNTVLDNLNDYKDNCNYTDTVLVTLHRRENHSIMNSWFTELNNLAIKHPHIDFILPLHPNPNVRKWKHLLNSVNVVNPLEHSDLLNILVKCKLVITDSGGLQEEGAFFNKKVIVCREVTERPEGIYSGHSYMCPKPTDLKPLFDILIKDTYINKDCPYGDGNSAELIINYINDHNNTQLL